MKEAERDPRVDAAWRAANRDEPPSGLDDAIRAAARRAVASTPRRKRDKHWWYPFAAAATVAVIAVGLLQLTPPEQVTPTTILSEAPETANRNSAAAPAEQPSPPAPDVSARAPSPQTRADSSSQASNAITPPNTAASRKKEAPANERERLAAMQNEQKPQRQLDAAEKIVRPSEESPASNTAVPATPPAELARRSEPFPAAKPEAHRDAAIAQDSQSQLRQRATVAASASAAPAAAAPAGGKLLKEAQTQSGAAKDELEAAPKSKTAPRSADDWIKLIRQLRSDGRTDEAVKELAAFRSAYGERADALLPSDLRQLAPAPAGAK